MRNAAITVVSAIALALGPGAPVASQGNAITPANLASRGLVIRSDTMDGYVGDPLRGQTFGRYVYAVARTTLAGRAVDLITVNYTSSGNEKLFQSDTLAVDAATLAPIWYRFHAKYDAASITFHGRHATGYAVREHQARVKVDFTLSEDGFDSGVARPMLSSLPLEAGYRTSFKSFNMWKNTEETISLAVAGSEVLEVSGRKVDCWVVSGPPRGANSSAARRWVAKASGQVMRSTEPSSDQTFWMVGR